MVLGVVLSVNNITSISVRAMRNNKKRIANAIQPKGEHNRHFLTCRLSVMFSVPVVLSWHGSSLLGRDVFKSTRV